MELLDAQIIEGVLAEFYPLCAIPHGSGNEEAVADYLEKRLFALGARVQRDGLHNLWADIPATKGRENEPAIGLQAHMDMVCAAGESDYDAVLSPIQTHVRDGWLSTGGRSSLGADCGAGVALILWLLGQKLSHPALRILLTAQEEIGLNGARVLADNCVAGVRDFLNLDGFAGRHIVVGAAGGTREKYTRPIERVPAPAGKACRIMVSGLTGGHSGFDIGEKRGNAILWMGEILRWLQTRTPFAIASLEGGNAFNAIPYSCEATIIAAIPVQQAVQEFAYEIRRRSASTDPDARIVVEPCSPPAQVWTGELTGGLLTLLGGFADGVYAIHPELPDTVSDSSNLGRLHEEEGVLCLDAMIRFMDETAEMALRQSHRLVAAMCGFSGTVCTRYPAWPVNTNSALTARMKRLYQKYWGCAPQVRAQHVGLELSYFYAKNPEMECVSLGMELEGCHSPDERWRLDSIPPLARILGEYLADAVER